MDARQRKTRALLFAAVLELAARGPVENVTVTDIARRASVHRSTFYEHAASPAELLRAALGAELDAVREQYLVGAPDVPAAVLDVTRAVLLHVSEHADVYRLGLATSSGALHDLLSEHFQESMRLLLASGLEFPLAVDGLPEALVDASAIRFVADGTVGAIAVWVRDSTVRDPDAFLALFAQLVPAWWPIAR